jgi:hypothetical protein
MLLEKEIASQGKAEVCHSQKPGEGLRVCLGEAVVHMVYMLFI